MMHESANLAEFFLSAAPLDPRLLADRLLQPRAGALATFEGWVRDHNEGRHVLRLEYEAYGPLALKEGARILEEAHGRFGILNALCAHRTGALEVGAIAVWVGTCSPHRDAAFAACRYIIDEIKQRVPIWKKELYPEGDSGWVNCPACAAPGHRRRREG